LKFLTYIGRIHGAAHIPPTYVIRDEEVTDNILAAEYKTKDERLVAMMVLEGAHYQLDNMTLYDEFKPLVVDVPVGGSSH
jgi:hypothetical protein